MKKSIKIMSLVGLMILSLLVIPTQVVNAEPLEIYVPSVGDVLIFTENSGIKEKLKESRLMTDSTGAIFIDEKIDMTTVYNETGTMEMEITGVNDTHFDSTETHIRTENATGSLFEIYNSTYDPNTQMYVWDNRTETGTPVETTEMNTSSFPYNSSYVPSGFEMGEGNFINVGSSKMPFQFGDDEEDQNGNGDNDTDLFTIMGLTDWNTSSWESIIIQKELNINNLTFQLELESWKLAATANANWTNDTFHGMPVPVKIAFEMNTSLIVDYDIATKLIIRVTTKTTMIMDLTMNGTTNFPFMSGDVNFNTNQHRVMNQKMESILKSHSSLYKEAYTYPSTEATPPTIIPSFTLSTVLATIGLITTCSLFVRRQRRT